MDDIRIGLDFGTHQTKICVQRVPDEGHGEPQYEFFAFKDLEGNNSYVLPSIIQINDDNTVSYGFVDKSREKITVPKPEFTPSSPNLVSAAKIQEIAQVLFDKYSTAESDPMDIDAIVRMLKIKDYKEEKKRVESNAKAEREFQSSMEIYLKNRSVFKYFKQATFSERKWDKTLECDILSVWYLAYVIFLLEEKYGTDFSLNMGIPADYKSYEMKKFKAVYILLSAYRLVEDVYHNDLHAFLKEDVNTLLDKTEIVSYSEKLKNEYYINVFPEAYASLISLTSRGKLSYGMSLSADIGGGTTDISFFTIQDSSPKIYRYWTIPRGLNYIAEESGFEYAGRDFALRVDRRVVDKYNNKKHEIISLFIKELTEKLIAETSIPVSHLKKALKSRIVVYAGGGSSYRFLTKEISCFSDVKRIDESIWIEENVKNKDRIKGLSHILSTAYGLSIGKSDEEVKLHDFSTLFDQLPKKKTVNDDKYIDKDMC